MDFYTQREEIDKAVKLLGYDSLADMRTEEHPDIMFHDYYDEYEMQEHRVSTY